MSELEIYLQEQSENDNSLKELQIQRIKEEQQINDQNSSSKAKNFLQKMNLKNFDSNSSLQNCQNQNNLSTNQQLTTFPIKRQDVQTSKSPNKRVSIEDQLNQEIQTNYCEPSLLIENQNEYELCKNSLKKPKNERNDKDLNVLHMTLGNNLQLLQKYKSFLPTKSFKELLTQFEYQECSPNEQILNIESKSTKIYFLMKGELGIFIPRIEDQANQQELYSTNNKEIEQNNISPIKSIQCDQIKSSQQKLFNQQGLLQVQNQSEKYMEESETFHRQQSLENIYSKKQIIQQYNTLTSLQADKNVIYDVRKVRNKFQQEMEEKFQNFKLIKFASAGDMFGETSLEYRNQEIFSVVCATHCEFAILSQSAYYNLFANKFFLTHLEINKMLKKTQLFYNWPHYSLYEYSKIAQRHVLGLNDVLFNVGDKIERIYFMCSGLIFKIHPQSTKNNESQHLLATFSGPTVLGEEGILNGNDDIQQIKTRKYQVVSKREDTILYSIEMNLFKNIYYYIIAKEGLVSFEQQEEKKKRKFLDNIYRSIRQMERVQILERTFDEIKKQRIKEEKRKLLQQQQIFNENQTMYVLKTEDKDNDFKQKNIIQQKFESKKGENIKINNTSQNFPKKRSLSQLNYQQSLKYGLVVVNSFNFTENQLNKTKQIQNLQTDKTLDQQDLSQNKNDTNQNLNNSNDNITEQQIDNTEQQQCINNNKQKYPQNNVNVIQKIQNQTMQPTKKLEQLKYDVFMQHINQQNLNNSQIKQNQNPQTNPIQNKSQRQRMSNCDQYDIQKYIYLNDQFNKQEDQQSSFKEKQNIQVQMQDQENTQNEQVKDIDDQDDIQMNEINKIENIQINIPNKTSRLFKVNYNSYKNIIQNVNKVQKINNFYDRDNIGNDLFRNTSVLFDKKENDFNQSDNLVFSSSTTQIKGFSNEKRNSSISTQSQNTFSLKKTPYQKHKDSIDEKKRIIRVRRSLSERKNNFSMKLKQFEQSNTSQNQLYFNDNSNNQYTINIIGDVLKQLANTDNCYDYQQSNTNNSNQQQLLQSTIPKPEQSNYKLQRNSTSSQQNNIIELLKYEKDSSGNPLLSKDEINQIKMINFQMPDSIEQNKKPENKVYNNVFKLRQKQNSTSKIRSKSIQLNQTEIKFDKSQPQPDMRDKMRPIQNHIQNFEFYMKCNKDQQKPHNIKSQNDEQSEDFASRPFTAAAVSNIFSKKTQIKDVLTLSQRKSLISAQNFNKNKKY